jgi:hypothetical protein
LLFQFEFLLALLVGCTLACGDFVQGAPLRRSREESDDASGLLTRSSS